MNEGARVEDAAVDVALSDKIDDRLGLGGAEDAPHRFPIADIDLLEPIARIALDVRQIFRIAGVRQLVDVDDRLVGIPLELVTDEVRADEAAPARDDQAFHGTLSLELVMSAGMRAKETRVSSSSRRIIRTPCVLRPIWLMSLAWTR